MLDFEASLPPTESALRLHGSGDGGRLTLQFTAEAFEKISLCSTLLTGRTLRVTITPLQTKTFGKRAGSVHKSKSDDSDDDDVLEEREEEQER